MNAPHRLGKLLAAHGMLTAPGVSDGITGRTIEEAGFNVIYRIGYPHERDPQLIPVRAEYVL